MAPAEAMEGYRLSPQQRRVWRLQAEGGSVYRAQCAIALRGAVAGRRLERALASVVARHEILRTHFRRLPGVALPVQVVAESAAPSFSQIDLRHLGGAQEAAVEALWQQELSRPSDLEAGSPVAVVLVRLGADSHLLLLGLPALCADARSLHNLVRQLGLAYGAAAPEDEDETLQYLQFAEWQNELLAEEDEESASGREFWRRRADGGAGALPLPGRNDAASAEGAEPRALALRFDAATTAAVETAAEELEATPAAVLLAAWQSLLWRLARQAEIVVGVACDGREHEVLEDALGLVAKWLPVPCRLAPGLSFSQVVARTAAAVEEAAGWQEYFAWGEERPEADGQAGFAAGFEFQSWDPEDWGSELRPALWRQSVRQERCDVALSVTAAGGSMTAALAYEARRFGEPDVRRLARQLATLLASALGDPQAPVGKLALLDAAERRRILVDFNRTAAPAPTAASVHELFERQAARTPGRPAVAFGGRQLTYDELNQRANQVARRLRSLGVGAESVVGLYVERSPEMAVAVLGILKAGGCYLPLDPTYPRRRLAFMLEDAAAAALVTTEELRHELPPGDLRVLCLDDATLAAESVHNPEITVGPRELAYVIFTSGSTGRPKGVAVEHRSVVNLAAALWQAVYPPEDRPLAVGLNAPLSFDASVKQLIQLLAGHTLHILPEEVRLGGEAMAAHVAEHGIEVLDCTPLQLERMLDAGLPQRRPRRVLVGGEALPESLWRRLGADAGRSFFNVYGPTECTVDAAVCRVGGSPAEPVIGWPVANVKIHLFDAALEPVPVGVTGELCVGGVSLARGYLSHPAMTAAKFVPDPFAAVAGERLYRTGDVGSYRDDGAIRFHGRRDDQVKVRGFRIELGEIEAELRRHPAVHQAAVAVRDDLPGDQGLAAYVVLRRKEREMAGQLRASLRDNLPEFMVPSAVMVLDRLPLTARGKVDRRALPAPQGATASEEPFRPPANDLERTLADIWQEVLGIEKVGTRDNFFDLGGHSLLLIQAHDRMRERLGRDVSLIELFRHPTVQSLAELLSRERAERPSFAAARERAQRRTAALRHHRRTAPERSP